MTQDRRFSVGEGIGGQPLLRFFPQRLLPKKQFPSRLSRKAWQPISRGRSQIGQFPSDLERARHIRLRLSILAHRNGRLLRRPFAKKAGLNGDTLTRFWGGENFPANACQSRSALIDINSKKATWQNINGNIRRLNIELRESFKEDDHPAAAQLHSRAPLAHRLPGFV